MEILKIVNYGKNGVYVYSAIVKTDSKLFWTECVHSKDKKDRYTLDFAKLKLTKELNQYSLDKYSKYINK